jgi:endonuclease/exonuclease/phosphatase family metal-dependent hydrolase
MARVPSTLVLGFGAIAIVTLAVIGLAHSVAARPTAGQETYLQFNMCGNVCNSGGPAVVGKLATVIGNQKPFAVTLNEVCESQFARLRADLIDYGGRFDPTGPICRDGARYGNAVLMRSTDVSLVGSWPLPNPTGGEPRRLMCVSGQPSGQRAMVACVTHLSTRLVDVAAQVQAVANVLNGLSRTDAAILLGGDFNTDPADARMNPLYPGCAATASFREVDSAGCTSRSGLNRRAGVDTINEETFTRHKYDYIFFSTRGWSSMTGTVTDTLGGTSDHKALWATATDTPALAGEDESSS